MIGNVDRDKLRKGFLIVFGYEHTSKIEQGKILHIGLGLAAKNAVWVKVTGGNNVGSIECVMLENIIGVVSYG